MNSRKTPPDQRGAALVVALLVVATVVVLATTLSGDFLLMFRRVENQMHSEQAYAYLLGAEGVARAALLLDLKQRADVDTLTEDWARPQGFPTDYGWISGQLDDLQGRFNLNLLSKRSAESEGGGNTGSHFSEPQRILIRLLQTLPLPEPLVQDQAEAITEAITDWVDADDEVTGLGGAESQYYADADPPGRPANTRIASPSELMWVRGMTPQIFRALAPLVTVWPRAGASINLNTAPAAVLASLNSQGNLQPLEAAQVEKILEARTAQGRLEKDAYAAENLQNPDLQYVADRSRYFQLTAQTELLGRHYTLRSVLRRSERGVRVVARTFGEW